jgi:hypothetical protein
MSFIKKGDRVRLVMMEHYSAMSYNNGPAVPNKAEILALEDAVCVQGDHKFLALTENGVVIIRARYYELQKIYDA